MRAGVYQERLLLGNANLGLVVRPDPDKHAAEVEGGGAILYFSVLGIVFA